MVVHTQEGSAVSNSNPFPVGIFLNNGSGDAFSRLRVSSPYTLFDSKQLFFIDLEWLGVGRVRCGFVVDGVAYYCHQFLNTNNLAVVYMTTPNLPVRYEIANGGTGSADTFEVICSSVISEGGQEDTGSIFCIDTGYTHLDANSADTTYALLGIRLKSTHLGTTVNLMSFSMLAETATAFRWSLHLNATVEGTFAYADITNSSCQKATGATANTVSAEGTLLASGYIPSSAQVRGSASEDLNNALKLGAKIDGTRDTIVLAVTPLAGNADIQGSLAWRELS